MRSPGIDSKGVVRTGYHGHDTTVRQTNRVKAKTKTDKKEEEGRRKTEDNIDNYL